MRGTQLFDDPNVMLLGPGDNGAVLNFTTTNGPDSEPSEDTKWVNWTYEGINSAPAEYLRLLLKSPILLQLIETAAEIIGGGRIKTFKTEIQEGKEVQIPILIPEIEEYFETFRVHEKIERMILDYLLLGSAVARFSKAKIGEKYILRHLDVASMRSGPHTDDGVQKMYNCPDWSDPKTSGSDKNVTEFWNVNHPNFKKKAIDGVLHLKKYLPLFPYYPPPTWLSSADWIKLLSKIPIWHAKGIDNGYVIRWLIKIPQSVLDNRDVDLYPKAADYKAFLADHINKWLSGVDNVGKGMITFFSEHGLGVSETKGWQVIPQKGDMQDVAYTALYEQGIAMTQAATGVDPSIAGIQNPGKLSSGSDKRIAYELFALIKAPKIQRIMNRVLNKLKELNKWPPEVRFMFELPKITTLSENKEGHSWGK